MRFRRLSYPKAILIGEQPVYIADYAERGAIAAIIDIER
jgi:hypothetical protein